jgi:hypothetical protein
VRSALAHVVVSEPDPSAARECPDCGFDALLTFPLALLSPAGVSPFGSVEACARCHEEDSRA